jgi:hypothetical protein
MSRDIAEQSRFSTDYEFAAAHPGVLGERPIGAMNRTAMHQLINERCALDSELRQSLYDHPRAIYAIAVEECFGIHRSLFFIQIRHVEVMIEDHTILGIVLSACHLACVAPRLPTGEEYRESQCHICCHRESPCLQIPIQSVPAEVSRSRIRQWIQNRAKVDAGFREQLIASPSSAWQKILQEINPPAGHPLTRIASLRLFVESSETIGFVLECDSRQEPSVTTHALTLDGVA